MKVLVIPGPNLNLLEQRQPAIYGRKNLKGIIINPGALREISVNSNLLVIEVHLSNIYAPEEWRMKSVIAPITRGQIIGLGWRGYLFGLEYFALEAGRKTTA